jgi:hypothetical protein
VGGGEGRAGQARRQDRQRLGQGVDLATEAAANRAADEMQLIRRHRVDLRRGIERKE